MNSYIKFQNRAAIICRKILKSNKKSGYHKARKRLNSQLQELFDRWNLIEFRI
ncbi:hypothetical protein CAMGR0001_1835 [Campylobacter gracilis RM3268]|uniref:Uncharacterized protein n=1 Tax=Campylobacter gracilis RM3268 TaxID=553220 RepID=C8PED4_9BACT|nr:hypothetical protein CAMGR0001_1835 [Campylobacter gracilis RM3268]